MISTVGLCAESSPPSAGANAPSEDSIAATRRDFDAIKAARNPAEAPKGDVPRFSVPDISSIAPNEPKPWLTKRDKDAAAEKKSANWLVDAMMKPDKSNPNGTSRGDSRKSTTKSGENLRNPVSAALEGEKDDLSPTSELKADNTASNSDKESAPDKERPHDTNAFNPFATYMASWMSPQDYTLLRPVVATGHADAASVAGTSPAAAAAAVGASSANPEADSMLSLAGAAKPAYQPATPMENPYLQAISLPPPPSVSTAAPAPVTPTTAPSAVFAPPPPMPDAKPVVPDFVKPSDDKYYKPLKRF